MWIYDTGEQKAMHIEGVTKSTVLDGFVYPLIAIRRSRSKNGYIHNDVSGGNVSKTGQYTDFTHEKQKTA